LEHELSGAADAIHTTINDRSSCSLLLQCIHTPQLVQHGRLARTQRSVPRFQATAATCWARTTNTTSGNARRSSTRRGSGTGITRAAHI